MQTRKSSIGPIADSTSLEKRLILPAIEAAVAASFAALAINSRTEHSPFYCLSIFSLPSACQKILCIWAFIRDRGGFMGIRIEGER
jgi:NO-binding membrane sensor protein with MHYT domain